MDNSHIRIFVIVIGEFLREILIRETAIVNLMFLVLNSSLDSSVNINLLLPPSSVHGPRLHWKRTRGVPFEKTTTGSPQFFASLSNINTLSLNQLQFSNAFVSLLPRPAMYAPDQALLGYGRSVRIAMLQPLRASANHDSTFSGTYYEILGVSSDESPYSIKSAYRKLARKYHPDVHSPDLTLEESTRRFLAIKEAYEVLTDPYSRAIYDYELQNPQRHGMKIGARFQSRPWFRRSRGPEESPLWTSLNDKHEVLASWKSQWTSQLSGLKNRKNPKPGSWASQMKRQQMEET